jgi:small-conductance mechanosensitive channel
MSEQFSTFFDEEEVITMTPFESTFPFISRIVGSPSQARDTITFLRQETSDIRQIALFALIGYGIPFLGNSVRKRVLKMDELKYKNTSFYHVLNHISQGFKLGAFITLIETISEMILGLDSAITIVMTNAISSILFSIWGMYRVKVLKNFAVEYFCKRINIQSKRLERFYETSSDYLIYVITAITALDTLGFKYQTALKSISVFGGVGTIVLSLASKDMSTQMLSGLSIRAAQQFEEGDELLLESGELGTVEIVGFLHTYIRGEIVRKL